MAQFLGPRPPRTDMGPGNGFEAMGRPIPMYRRQAGYQHCKQMGLDTEDAWSCVNGMSEQLERDEPYAAMDACTGRIDVTGMYRLMAVLLTAPEPETSSEITLTEEAQSWANLAT